MSKLLFTFFLFLFTSNQALAARIINSATVDGAASTTVSPSTSITATVNVTTTGSGANGRWRSTGWRIAGSSGTLTCEDHPNYNSAGTYTENFPITAPAVDGIYNLYLVAYRNDSCTQGASTEFILSNSVVVVSASIMPDIVAGQILLNDTTFNPTFSRVCFAAPFSQAPLIFSTSTNEGSDTDPATIRIRNVTTDGFEISMVEPSANDGLHTGQTVDFMAIEPGDYTLKDGTRLLANSWQTSTIQSTFINANRGWDSINFSPIFSNPPAILSTIQSMNNESSTPPSTSSIPWLSTAIRNVQADRFDLALERAESTSGSVSVNETVGYLAVEAGQNGEFNDDFLYESIRSNDSVSGWNNGCFTSNFNSSFSSNPLTIATQNTRDGGDGGWIRRCSLSPSAVGLTVDEDVDNDADRNHTTERAGILALSGAFNDYTNSCLPIPMAEWRFDECNYTGAAGEVIDSQGNYNATAFFGVNTNSPGQVENFLDATSNRHQVRTVSPIPLPAEWSVSVWFKTPFVTTQRYHVLGSMDGGGDLMYLDRNANFRWGVYTPGIGVSAGSFQFGTLADGWHHMALVGNNQGANGETLLYLDGAFVESVNLQSRGNLRYIGTSYDGANGTGAQSFGTGMDEFIVFNQVLNTADVRDIYYNQLAGNNYTGSARIGSICNAVDHYAISHSGVGVTCEAETLTVTAHDASDNAVAPTSSTTISLTTSIANDGLALKNGNGTFTSPNQYTFDGTETAVEFWLTKTSATTTPHMDIDVTDGTVTDLDGNATEDPNLEFRDTAFRFYADGIHNDIGSQIAGKGSEVAPGDQVLALRAVQTNTDTGACEARISGTQAVEMAFECDNPTTCKTNNGVTIIDSVIGGAGDAVNDNPAGGPLVYSNVDLTFDASGIATWSMNYLDAGQITLHALLNIPASGNDPADSLAGSSNSFPSIPAGLCVSSPDVDADCGSGNASCSAFKRAGETFNLSVKAVGWQSSGESNTDYCTGNTTTPNFQLAGITLNQTLVAPVGVAGNLGIGSMDIAAADDGDATINNQSLSEVGVFTLTATAPSYFGETIAASTSANIGRFYPDHFVLSDMQLINRSDLGCASAFTYMDENFQVSFDLEAQNTANTVTQNYSGAFAKLDSAAELNYGAVDLSLPTDLSTRLNVGAPTITFTAGRADDLTDTLFLSRLVGGPDGPFSLSVGIAPVDDDGVSLDSYNLDVVTGGGADHGLIQSALINYGRLTVGNAHGSELLPLTIPLKAQFYDGLTGSFIGAAIDNCTLYDAPLDINLASAAYTGPLTAGDLGLTGAGNLVAGLASFSVHDDISNTVGPGVTGDVTFVKVVPAYLQYDWDGDNSFNDEPWARATFGIFGGNSKQIYYRQLYR